MSADLDRGLWQMRRRAQSRGFTLLEMLLAVALFALTMALAYGGLSALLRASEQLHDSAGRLGRLQFALTLFERDLDAVAERGVRDAYGSTLAAVQGTAQRLEFTRHGHANRLALPRAELERVAWLRRGDGLYRLRWNVLDRAPGSEPSEDRLLDGVGDMRIAYLDAQGREFRQWPPPRESAVLPRALRVEWELEGFGTIRRVLELPQVEGK